MTTEITGISAGQPAHPIVSPRPGTASYLVRITGTGADTYVNSARVQTIAGMGLLGGGMYAALKYANNYWGYAIGALGVGGLLVANAMFNTLGGLNKATRDFARKNFSTQYFDSSQIADASSSSVPGGYPHDVSPQRSLSAINNLVTKIGHRMSIAPYGDR